MGGERERWEEGNRGAEGVKRPATWLLRGGAWDRGTGHGLPQGEGL